MTGAELADELSTIADAYCADTREAWRMARFVNANMVAILAALRSERPASDVGAVDEERVERVARAIASADGFYDGATDERTNAKWAEHWRWYIEFRGKGGAADHSNQARWERMARAALAAAQEG